MACCMVLDHQTILLELWSWSLSAHHIWLISVLNANASDYHDVRSLDQGAKSSWWGALFFGVVWQCIWQWHGIVNSVAFLLRFGDTRSSVSEGFTLMSLMRCARKTVLMLHSVSQRTNRLLAEVKSVMAWNTILGIRAVPRMWLSLPRKSPPWR